MNPDWRCLADPRYLLALGFGSGLSPKAPGTVGSALALLLYIPLSSLGPLAFLAVVVVTVIGGVFLCDWVARDMNIKDPGAIVIDEFAGMWIALLWLPASSPGGWFWLTVGFVLFRLFDILKPWPISWCDRSLDGGLGIMLDDVVAGLLTLALVQLMANGSALL